LDAHLWALPETVGGSVEDAIEGAEVREVEVKMFRRSDHRKALTSALK
jgi:hypothetical protein